MSLPPPPEGIDLTEDRKPDVIAAVTTLLVLAAIAVALRIIARLSTKNPLKWDDYLILISLLLAFATGGMTYVVAYHGVGRHIWAPGVSIGDIFKDLAIYEFLYGSVVSCTKMSILLFYKRIFAVSRFNYMLYFCMFLVIGWWIGIMVVAGVQCRPYEYFWTRWTDPTAKGVCVNDFAFFIGNGSTSVVIDFLILLVPAPMVWKLQMPTSQKITVYSIFLLGGFVCIAGVIRVRFLTDMYKTADFTFNTVEGFIWSSVEPCIGIVSACLPTLRPLLRRVLPSWFSPTSRTQPTPKYYNQSSSKNSKVHDGDFYRLQDGSRFNSRDDEVVLTANEFVGSSPQDAKGFHGSPSSIAVQRDFEWSSRPVSGGRI